MSFPGLSGFIDAALVGTACVAVLLPAFRLFPVRPALRHLVWLVVAVRFLVPTPGWGWQPLGDGMDAWVGALVSSTPAPTSVTAPDATSAPADGAGSAGVPGGLPGRVGWVSLLASLWMAGALTLLVVRVVGYVRWRRLVGRGAPAPAWLVRDTRMIADRLGITVPRVVTSPHVRTPAVAGLLRPLLVWPEETPVPLDAAARRAVVAHEMAHLRRRDLWAAWMETAVEAAWWWYPPARRVCRELSASAEEACDRWVLSLYPEHRRAYAEALFAVAAAPHGPPVPRLAHSLTARSLMERRLEGIAFDRLAPGTRRGERALVMLAALAVIPAGVMTRDAPSLAVDGSAMAGILGRGDVRVTATGAPVAKDDGWIVAFRVDGDGGFHVAFATASGATTLDDVGNRSPVERGDRAWIHRLARDTRWSVEPGSRVSASGALVPAGPHVHLASEGRTLAVWSAVATPFDDRGGPGAETTESHPVVAALWSADEPLRLYRFWRDERGRARGERYGADGRTELADPGAVAADIGAAVRAARAR